MTDDGAHPTLPLGGLRFSALTSRQVLEHVSDALVRGRGGWIVTPNVDILRRTAADPQLRALYATADLVLADGQPLLWASRLAGCPLPERVAGADLAGQLAALGAARGRRLFLLGGGPGVAAAAARALARRHPSLVLAGLASPWFSEYPTEGELAAARRALVDARPDLVLVGLSSPKQDRVVVALRRWAPRAWFLGCGAGLAFLSGRRRRAPHWAQKLGLEWLFRLAQEPRRLGRRYLLEDLPFALRLLLHSWRNAPASDERPVLH